VGTRLVTLTGLGGTGKTRLALEVARRLQEGGGGWMGFAFVPLVDLTDPCLLLQTLRGALNLPVASDTDPLQQIAAYLANQRFLLVLDNFEQLLDAGAGEARLDSEGRGRGPGMSERSERGRRFGRAADRGYPRSGSWGRFPGADILRQLLERAPGLVCLVTSRRSLGLTAEREYPVAPLPTPATPAPPERLLEFASVCLFLSRARVAQPDFQMTAANAEAVSRLCQALEGIPLALELAAARSPVLTPAQMLEHLSDRFALLVDRHRKVAERHRTLRTALEWSYQSLPEGHQSLLSRLSVFRGGWTPEAAEAVCGDFGFRVPSGRLDFGLGPTKTSDRPETLSLPAIQNPKSKIQNILDALLELRDAALVIAEEAGEGMRFRMLETVREYAEERLVERGEAAAVRERHRDWYLGLAERTDRVLEAYGRPTWSSWLDRLDTEHDNLRAALACCLAEDQARASEASGWRAQQGLRLATALVQFWEVRGYVGEGRSWLAKVLGREAGEERFDRESDQGVPAQRVLGPGPGGASTPERGRALRGAAELAWMQGDPGAARTLLLESLATERTSGDPWGIAWSLHQLGRVASNQGDYGMAREHYQESLAIFRQLEHPSGIAASLADQGNMALKQGDLEAARCFYEESLAIFRELGYKVSIAIALNNLGKVAREQGNTRTARALHAESLTIRQELGDKGGYPWSLEAFARLAAPVDPVRAARLWGAAEALRESLGLPLPPSEREEYDRCLAATRASMGEEAFADAWAAGRAMTLEEGIRCALEAEGK
jgi:non-specific serine/threonine protein kinase